MRAISETVTTAFASSDISTPFGHKSDAISTAIRQMLPASGKAPLPDCSVEQPAIRQMFTAQCSQLPPPLIVLVDQPDPNQKRLDHLTDGSSRKPQAGRQDIQPG